MTQWCIAYRRGSEGEHKCVLGHDVLQMAGGCTFGMRFTMPCNDDRADGFSKMACPDMRTPHDEIMARAAEVRKARRDEDQQENDT